MVKEILEFENRIQGYKTRVKELHFAATKRSIHVVLDDFEGELSEFEDEIMEEFQGIHGQFVPGEIKPVLPRSLESEDLLREIRVDLIDLREMLDQQTMYSGSVSVLDDFLHKVNKTIYLLRLSQEG